MCARALRLRSGQALHDSRRDAGAARGGAASWRRGYSGESGAKNEPRRKPEDRCPKRALKPTPKLQRLILLLQPSPRLGGTRGNL